MLPFISERPSWCISRQRVWGVPIPVLFKINDKSPIIDYDLIDHIASRVASEGSDFWFSETLDQLVPEYFWKKWGITSDDVYKSTEVFDVWFDSGLSWLCVLNSGNYSHQPGSHIIADTYLEGHDQFRGWFSASLLLSVALTGYAPFKDLIVHGFVADSQGCKMSKSLGNGITPKELIANENGCIDIMRRWVCSSGLDSVCRLGSKEMKQNNTGYKALRNSLRFMLGNLYDFCPITQIKHTLDLNSMDTSYSLSRLVLEMINSVQENNDNSCLGGMDKSVLYSLGNIVSTSLNIYYPQFRYDTILAEIDQFLSHFSSVYITSVKDRLYFNHPDDPFRRNTQIVFWLTVECLKAILAPILPYLMEEIEIVTWNYLSSNCMILKHQYETLLERYSSLTLHDYYCVDEWKICSDWLLCLSAMQQWNEFKIYSTYVNKASLLFHSLINTLSKDRDALPSSNNSLSVCHVHINIPTKDHDMYCMLKALHPLESVKSISSDLCYLLRAASVSWSCGLYPNEFLNATRYYNFPLNDAFVSIKFLSEDEGIRCHRCHRYSLKDSSKNLCYRCTKVLNTSILVKTSSESL
ncbi:unnamed protein product [Heterobilharzia americana]|nr:unnamed protein product [Heterobilharzia americana]